MKQDTICYTLSAVLCAAWLLSPSRSEARPEVDISVRNGADRCSDLRVRSSGELAQTTEAFTLTRAEAPSLELNTPQRSVIRVRGWDRPDYSVEACKFAAADDRATADRLLKEISITRSAGRLTSAGPTGNEGRWLVYFIVHTPENANLDLETRNGPVDIGGVRGNVKVRASNGPISIRDSSGTLDARTHNGPISFSGGSGDVRLNAQNGPISLRLSGEAWEGPRLEAATVNGPVSLALPEKFRTGVRLETSGHSPISCRAGACAGASSEAGPDGRTVMLNGSSGTVRLSTENGPVSVTGGGKLQRVI